MHVIVGGCGRLGSQIATKLSDDPNNDVVAIDTNPLAFDRLGSAFNGETLIGNVTDRTVLERAGISHCDAMLAVTRSDNANLMAVEVATHLYHVPNVVARLFNPEREPVYRKLGIRYVSSTGMLANLFLTELHAETFRTHVMLPSHEVAVVDMTVGAESHGMTVEDFELHGKLRIAAITRADRVLIPDATDRLERGDVVTGAARRGAYRKLRHLIDARERSGEDT